MASLILGKELTLETWNATKTIEECRLISQVQKEIIERKPPKGLAIKEVRNLFFPYWKSLLSRRLCVKIIPSCQLSRKDLLSVEASRKRTKSATHPCIPKNSMGNLGSTRWSPLSSNYESRRMLCAVTSISRKIFRSI
uniref:Uncharacterized protein n=1 Tax=Leersia perrieri TaxID=77586 RepID=A0A0D9XRD4_9ORYZ